VRGLLHSMPQMFGNLSIRPKMAVGLLAVPVAAAALLGGTMARPDGASGPSPAGWVFLRRRAAIWLVDLA
jgi:hypothetical protein